MVVFTAFINIYADAVTLKKREDVRDALSVPLFFDLVLYASKRDCVGSAIGERQLKSDTPISPYVRRAME